MTESSTRILVCDDEATITDFVGFALQKEGYAADIVKSGEEAIEAASNNDYDLFILDIMLPGMDGYELCRRLRTSTDAPVLFLSARDTELDKVVGLEIGGDDYLVKPFGVRKRPRGRHRQRHHARRRSPHRIRRQGPHRPHSARVRASGFADEERRQGGLPRRPAA